MKTSRLRLSLLLPLAAPAALASAQVYSNDFESNANGFTASGSLTGLSTASLPTDSGGLASANQSKWLGPLGAGVAKSGSTQEIATLALTGLTAGTTYALAFDLFIGASWDGSAASYGPDSWRCTVDGTNLVNTTFANGAQGINFGAYSPQKYSDATYNGLTGADFPRFTGADASFSLNQDGNYASDYSIYRFGRGLGNPYLTFVAQGPTSSIQFARYGDTTDSADEYWALDNVQVARAAPVPEPAPLGALAVGALAFLRRRARHG